MGDQGTDKRGNYHMAKVMPNGNNFWYVACKHDPDTFTEHLKLNLHNKIS